MTDMSQTGLTDIAATGNRTKSQKTSRINNII